MANEFTEAHESAYVAKMQEARNGALRLIDELIEDVQASACDSDPNACWAHLFNNLKHKMEEKGGRGPLMVVGVVAELITLTLTTPSPSSDASGSDC